MRVIMLTTSYPRYDGDVAGVFLQEAVEDLRVRGLDVDVVSPARFHDYGIAYGDGVAGNLRRSPAKGVFLPLFLASFARAAREAGAEADLVHAHWLPSGLPALATGRPYVLTMHGTDAELARRLPALFRPIARRARLVIAVSESVARVARLLGSREMRIVPVGVTIPEETSEPDGPPRLLFVGRLSEEKGVPELLEAARGLPLTLVGDGPLRSSVPEALGFVPPAELGKHLDRAAVVVCPSRREGYGVVARQAMAHGRPVVATAVGGLAEAVVDGETGLLVEPGDVSALRGALERLLADAPLRARMGAAGRERVRTRYSREVAATATVAAYASALA
jgi:glycosyltransferase involved in cell wall biosynthesis